MGEHARRLPGHLAVSFALLLVSHYREKLARACVAYSTYEPNIIINITIINIIMLYGGLVRLKTVLSGDRCRAHRTAPTTTTIWFTAPCACGPGDDWPSNLARREAYRKNRPTVTHFTICKFLPLYRVTSRRYTAIYPPLNSERFVNPMIHDIILLCGAGRRE